MRGTRTLSAVAAAGLVAVAAGAFLPSARAADSARFTLSARADALGIQTIAKDAPVVSIAGGEIALVTPSSSQSELDSFGGSRSFASAPYPGALLVSLPATLAGVSNGASPVPEYPAYVSSDFPVRGEQVQQFGPLQLIARSAENSGSAQAQLGIATTPPEILAAITKTSVVRDPVTGAATASADASVQPFTYNDVLRIGQIHTTAKAVHEAGASEPTMTSTFDAGNVTIAGQTFGLTKDGLVAPGTKTLLDEAVVKELLKNTGTFLEVLPEHRTATTITSASLRLTYQQDLPNAGLTTVRLILGQASATALSETDSAAPAVKPVDSGVSPVEVPIAGPPPASSLDPVVAVPPVVVDGAPVQGSPAPPPTVELVPRPPQSVQLLSSGANSRPDYSGFYAILVVGAVAAIVTARIRSAGRFV